LRVLSTAVTKAHEWQPGEIFKRRLTSRNSALPCQDIPFAAARAHNLHMSVEAKITPPEVLQRVIWIQSLTLIWMSV
jgi:hypothetical protein